MSSWMMIEREVHSIYILLNRVKRGGSIRPWPFGPSKSQDMHEGVSTERSKLATRHLEAFGLSMRENRPVRDRIPLRDSRYSFSMARR